MLRFAIPITKVDVTERTVHGLASCDVPDCVGEVCDYASTKPLYEKWAIGRATGNLLAAMRHVVAGSVTAIGFNDAARQIALCAKVDDEAEWAKVMAGAYTGFAQAGCYARRWTDDSGATRYTAEPHELYLVDQPCDAEARFELVLGDNTRIWRPFAAAVRQPGKSRPFEAVGRAGSIWTHPVSAGSGILLKPGFVGTVTARPDGTIGVTAKAEAWRFLEVRAAP